MTTEAVAAPAQPRADRYLIFGVLAISLLAFVMQFAMVSVSLADLIKDLTEQMMGAARDLQFELAARLRDEVADLKKELRGMDAAGLK